MKVYSPFLICFTILTLLKSYYAVETLTRNQTLTDTGQTLDSSGGSFKLGFFSPWNSSNRYVGIWFRNVPEQTVVWVANRNSPLSDSSGVLRVSVAGTLQILNNQSDVPIWSSDFVTASNNPILQLLDTGNLVVRNGSDGNYLWQSFDHPCDTLIPGMKLGYNLENNQSWNLNSWKNFQDPSNGDFTYQLEPLGLPQLVLYRKSLGVAYRSGPWDGVRFGGGHPLQENAVFNPIFVLERPLIYYSFTNNDNTTISRFVVNKSGLMQHLTWNQRRMEWTKIFNLQIDKCDEYDVCGPNGVCNANKPCRCPKGFVPKVPQDWNKLDTSGGCVRRTPLNCSSSVGFKKLSGIKFPDSSQFFIEKNISTSLECEVACMKNCSCTAYARTEFSGCVAWFGDLLDMREYSVGGQVLHIKVDASDLEPSDGRTAVIILVSIIAGVLLSIAVIWVSVKKRNTKIKEGNVSNRPANSNQDGKPDDGDEEMDQLPMYEFVIILSATNNFSIENKIGEGGFGAVYMGELATGQQVAVKRLSKDSGQGIKEFKNEVIFISKLQHRNLVRLLGCCIHGDERMLVYEYLPKRSLDFCLFDQTRGTSLTWQTRFNIIVGVARGLLYLHRDSRLRIIHRDLKASNILLDDEMNPKISDFGLARTFGGDQNEVNTSRVFGTYGYMSPEYVIDGLFSVKSDVFSFGVLVLEIVSGKKNRGFYHPEHDLNLLGHAWRLWIEDKPTKLMDSLMEQPVDIPELVKCIHVGLLCVQQRPEDRPTMASVVMMLDNENPTLPEPKQPGYYTERFFTDTDSSSTNVKSHTRNQVTVTLLQGRPRSSMKVYSFFLICFPILTLLKSYYAIDILTPNRTLTDTGQTLDSSGGSFRLGFFSPWNSNNRYVGIWFKNVPKQTVVWVANRNNPLSDSSGILRITVAGTIQMLNNQSDIPIWSSDLVTASNNPILQLLNTGNLVMRNGSNGGNYLWQSFDQPCDTLIPGMKLGWNLENNQSWNLNSWKSLQDPSNGDFTYQLDPLGLPQIVLYRKGLGITYRSGPWDGVRFGGGHPFQENAAFIPMFVLKRPIVYYSYTNNDNTTFSRFVVNQSGLIQHLIWNERRMEWAKIVNLQNDKCDEYNVCGPNGFCNANKPCRCPKGFMPKVPQDWNELDTSGGCVRRTFLNCSGSVGFKKFSGIKLPDSSQFFIDKNISTSLECEAACMKNCSCTAYARTEFSGCVAWFGDLLDIREYSVGGQVLYIKLDASDLDPSSGRTAVTILVPIVAGVLLLIAVICVAVKKRNTKIKEGNSMLKNREKKILLQCKCYCNLYLCTTGKPDEGDEDMDQLPMYEFVIILSATNNFSVENKIGVGGFGAVYKGELATGQQVAVKRLSKDSGQGVKEFKNEVIFISKLQHRNLVRLLGCCIHGDERMLVYEYLPKRSLDVCLFDQTRGTSLTWQTRFNIIVGVARGLLYLHRDSRLRIIHRDLKASNILLDDEMNPKISDFGWARTFRADQNEVHTSR
ncbi:G-type lectin S-receptor-like serine/threonine-protein kinase At4g27290 [Mercurialis annua]|uniref:G-type lectin S-receptor-like serine/threonine-protein kinase At4g27290 n=1 Tax=Mercurialis annua TaxID=3986 RepID=UPI0024AF3BE7|nr:G-type lectin S-receptor-like serine/threonine-protein kinase At4g27290 [Mercurialis annua]